MPEFEALVCETIIQAIMCRRATQDGTGVFLEHPKTSVSKLGCVGQPWVS